MRKGFGRLVAVSVSVAGAMSCAHSGVRPFQIPGRVVGEVHGGVGGLSGASVWMPELGFQAIADSAGNVVLRGKAVPGCYWAIGQRIGYQPSYTEVQVVPGGGQMVPELELDLATILIVVYTHVPGPCTRSDSAWKSAGRQLPNRG